MAKPVSWAQTTGCGKLNAVPRRCLVATFQPQHMPSRAVYGHLLRLNRLPNAPQACLLLWATRAWTCKYSSEPVAEIPVPATERVWIRPKLVWVDPRSFLRMFGYAYEKVYGHNPRFMGGSAHSIPANGPGCVWGVGGFLRSVSAPNGDVALRCSNGDPSVFRSLFKA